MESESQGGADDLFEMGLGQMLGPDEELIWSGRPRQGFGLAEHDIRLIPFSLAWNAFTVFAFAIVIRSEIPSALVILLWWMPAMGLYLLIGRFFLNIKRRRGIRYALTSRRIAIMSERPGVKTISIGLEDLDMDMIKLRSGRGGVGSIRFGDPKAFDPWRASIHDPLGFYRPVMAFELIQRARDVYEMIAEAKKNMGPSG